MEKKWNKFATDLDSQREMIILESLLTTSEESVILWSSWGISENWLKPKTNPKSSLAKFVIDFFQIIRSVFMTPMNGERGVAGSHASIKKAEFFSLDLCHPLFFPSTTNGWLYSLQFLMHTHLHALSLTHTLIHTKSHT